VTAPDGTCWRVRRRWLDRPAPKPFSRWRSRRTARDDGAIGDSWGLSALMDGLDGLAVVVTVIAAILLVVFVVLPLLGIAFELALLLGLLAASLFGRVVLRRPWTIEAVSIEDPTRRSAFAVTGWRRSRRALTALAAAVETTGPPAALPEAEPLPREQALSRTPGGVLPPAER
jgi:hypothetical protein